MTAGYDRLCAAMRWWWFWPLLILACAMGERIGHFYVTQMLSPIPTYVMDSRMLTTELRAGETLRLLVNRPAETFGRSCPGQITREVHHDIEYDGRVINEKWRLPLVGPPIPIKDEHQYILEIALPANIAPGRWRFRGRTLYDCGFLFGGRVNYDTEVLPFTVAPK